MDENGYSRSILTLTKNENDQNTNNNSANKDEGFKKMVSEMEVAMTSKN